MKVKVGTGDIGFCGLLTLLFIGLKLTGYIDWSWVWVLAPIWISLCITLIFLIFLFVIGLVNQVNRW